MVTNTAYRWDNTKQGELPLQREAPPRRGGKREGAGRPKSKGSGVSHNRRPNLASRYPVHVTLKVRRDVGSLRRKQPYRVLRSAFEAVRGKQRFRVCHYSVQRDHIHVVVEAKDRQALSRGLQGLSIRMARGINGCLQRRGKEAATLKRPAGLYGPRHGARTGRRWSLNWPRRRVWRAAVQLTSTG